MSDADRPRERLFRRGLQVMGDEDLLAVVLGTGIRARSARAVASDLVTRVGGVPALSRASPRELAQVTGVGEARAARIAAAFELGRRAVEYEQYRAQVARPDDIYHQCAPRLSCLQQEVFLAVGIDVRNGLLDIVEVARGTVHGVDVHPREVFRPLIRMAAAGAVLVHNHPTGDPTPSHEDVELTRRMKAIGDMIGIPVIDHVVIGDRGFRSVAEWLGTDIIAMPHDLEGDGAETMAP